VRVPLTRWWISPLGNVIPIRGWILQQLIKLSAPEVVDADVFVFADSEVAFVRPFTRAHVVDSDGRVRFYRCPHFGRDGRHAEWQRAAARLIGTPDEYSGADYVAPLTSWRRDVLVALRARIERARRMAWRRALAHTLDFSEYVLYGVFCDRVLGLERAGHFATEAHLCHTMWEGSGTPEAMSDHAERLQRDHVAVLAQSRLRVDDEHYARWVRGLWATAAAAE
jgi:hypothetical protein